MAITPKVASPYQRYFLDPADAKEYIIQDLTDVLAACQDLATKDRFVAAILASVPEIAFKRGVYTEQSLERRFECVYRECRKAVCSWYKRPFYFWNVQPKYLSDCDMVDPCGMSEHELLIQADYFLKKGLIDAAVRCMVQLEGVPRTLAQDWLDEARLFLTLVQAAEALDAYALNRGMGTIF